MRLDMRATIPTRIHAPLRVEARRRAARAAAIVLASGAFQFASAQATFVAKAHAQGVVPTRAWNRAPDELVRCELLSDVETLAPGRRFRLAVRFVIADGWHLNWLNPGDAGLAPGIEWRLPDGFKASIVCWPYPQRFPAGPLVIFGYAQELVLVAEITPPGDLSPGPSIAVGAEVTWLACEEACVPGTASLSLQLPVAASPRASAPGAARVEASRARCPAPAGAWSVDASVGDSATLLLDLQTAEEGRGLNGAVFFPYDPNIVENASPQLLSVLPGPNGRSAYQLRVELARLAPRVPERLRGVLVVDGSQAFEVDVPVRRR
jgi:thiol:disulfide interchange protein DsbD